MKLAKVVGKIKGNDGNMCSKECAAKICTYIGENIRPIVKLLMNVLIPMNINDVSGGQVMPNN
jgi:hypothetical protein